MISYAPFWETLKKKNISQYQLINEFHFSAGQLSRMRANNPVSTHTLDKLCEILNCTLPEVAEYQKKDDTLG